MGFFSGPGTSMTNSNELADVTSSSRVLRFKVTAFYSFTRHILTALSMFLVGWLMEYRKNLLI